MSLQPAACEGISAFLVAKPPWLPPAPNAVERLQGKASSSSLVGKGEHRWGAPFPTQVALLFRRSLRTRRFQARGPGCVARMPWRLAAALFCA